MVILKYIHLQVMELLPLYVGKEGVVAIGEIGYDDQTEAEDKFYRLQLELAKEVDLPVLIHTPHRDKRKGTIRVRGARIGSENGNRGS